MSGSPVLRRQVRLVLALAALALVAGFLPLGGKAIPVSDYLPLHTLLEFLSATVGLMVFATVWNTADKDVTVAMLLIAMAFLNAGLLDFAHALSITGMADAITSASPEKGIDFWLVARFLVAATFLALSLRPARIPPSAPGRYLIPVGYGLAAVAIYVAVMFFNQMFSATFQEDQGITQLKTVAEWIIAAMLATTAWRYYREARTSGAEFPALFFGATAVVALSEFFFASYSLAGGVSLLLGHGYRIIGYYLIYRAMFIIGTRKPYNRLAEQTVLLSKANETLRTQTLALASTATPVVVADAQGQVIWRNKASHLILSDEEIGPGNFSLFSTRLTPDPDVATAMRATLLTGQVWRGLVHFGDSQGKGKILDRTVTPLRSEAGAIEGFVSVSENVTDTVQAQLRHKRVLDTALDGFWIVDAEGHIVEANQAYATMSGYSVDELLTKSIADLETAEEAEEVQRHIRKVVQQGYDKFETRHRSKSGKEIFVEISVTFDRETQQFFAFIRDITAREESAAAKQLLERQLQQAQKMETMGQMTGGIAHDFNNILASVLGYSRLALDRLVPDKQSKLAAYLTEVIKASERARDLIAKMLTFTRTAPSAGLAPITPAAVVRDALAMLRPSMPPSIHMNLRIDDDLAILMDAGELHQILLNLLINARDAIEGQGDISIWLRRIVADGQICAVSHQHLSGPYLSLEVADSGSGIAPEHIPRLFDPFFTTKDVGKGTGLGLSMVQGLMRRSGGYIVVESQPGHGSRFQLFFPIATSPHPAADTQTAGPDTRIGAGQRIWVVDDEPGVARYLHELLAGQDYQVTVFHSPAEALANFERGDKAIDLLITDKTMPGMSGNELARRLHESVPDLPVIMCSGYSSDASPREGLQDHIHRLFIKPIQADELLKAIADELAHGSQKSTL